MPGTATVWGVFATNVPKLIDTYSIANIDTTLGIRSGGITIAGQSVATSGQTLSSIMFSMFRTGSPTGDVTATVYANANSFGGTDDIATGGVLATSDPISAVSLATTTTLVEFIFSGVNSIVLTNPSYIFVVNYPGGNVSNYVNLSYDLTAPTHAGNMVYFNTVWNTFPTGDVPFLLYGY